MPQYIKLPHEARRQVEMMQGFASIYTSMSAMNMQIADYPGARLVFGVHDLHECQTIVNSYLSFPNTVSR